MHGILREESAQATVEYAIVTAALLSIVPVSYTHLTLPTKLVV